MEGNEFIVAIVAIVFGTAFTGFVLYLLFSTIKAWINKKNSPIDEEGFDRMARAFIQHKKDTERRLENLEAIVTNENEEFEPGQKEDVEIKQKELAKPEQTIEIEEEPPKKKEHTESGNLKNILKE